MLLRWRWLSPSAIWHIQALHTGSSICIDSPQTFASRILFARSPDEQYSMTVHTRSSCREGSLCKKTSIYLTIAGCSRLCSTLASCRAVLPALMLSHATDFITLVSPVSLSTAVAVQPCPPLRSYAQSQLTSPVCMKEQPRNTVVMGVHTGPAPSGP